MNWSQLEQVLNEMRIRIGALAKSWGCQDQDEVFQQVQIRCWQNVDMLRQHADPSGWIMKVALNEIKQLHRGENRRRKREASFEVCAGTVDSARREEIYQQVSDAANTLPSPYRDVVLACDLGPESIQCYAERTSRPIETCRTQLKRARSMLRCCDYLDDLVRHSEGDDGL